MFTLRLEHSVPDFESWKRSFDGDTIGREKSGVRSYRVSRPVHDRNFVMVDLEFDTASEAEALLAAMRVVRRRAQGSVMENPHGSIVEVVEAWEYGSAARPP
jgi:ribosomal protein L35AE/L33A